MDFIFSEPPSIPIIQALRDNQPVTEVNDGETLEVECTVERVYPVDNLEFQLMSGGRIVHDRESGDTPVRNSDGTFSITKFFSVEFSRSYSSAQQGLTCGVFHSWGDSQSERLPLTVSCELPLRTLHL